MTISWRGRKAVSYFYAIIIGACLQHYFPGESALINTGITSIWDKIKILALATISRNYY